MHIHVPNTLFLQQKGIHPKIFQWQAILNCWPGLTFWTTLLRFWAHLKSNSASVRSFGQLWCHCCAILQTDGWGTEKERQKCHCFDILRHPVLFVTPKSGICCWLESKKFFGELMWLHTVQRQRKDDNPLLGPLFNLYFEKMEEILRFVWTKNTKLFRPTFE